MYKTILGLLVSSSLMAGQFLAPTEAEMKAAKEAAGSIQCKVQEQLTKCTHKEKDKCTPGFFTSNGHTQEECKTRVLTHCQSTCESPVRPDPKRPCKCGPVTFAK